MSSVKISSNFSDILADMESRAASLTGKGIRASVWTDVEYAIYTEFGTYKMAPHAMVRSSIPNIKAFFEQEWAALTAVDNESLTEMISRVTEYAKNEIQNRTHVDTGRLKKSWKRKRPTTL